MDRFVPKVHPATRLAEADDPMELIAAPAIGDPDVMLECLVQDFAGMGCDAAALLAMFHSPAYPLLNGLLELMGEDYVRFRITTILGRSGVFRVRETLVEDDSFDDDDEPELIELSVARLARRN